MINTANFYKAYRIAVKKSNFHLPNSLLFGILTMLCYVGSQRCPILASRYSEAESRFRRIVWKVSYRSCGDDTGVLCNVIL